MIRPPQKVMTMKLIFEKETFRLLGARIVGYEGVAKRIEAAFDCGMDK